MTPDAGGALLTFPAWRSTEPWLSKRQIATHYGRSTRWIELMARQGMPSRMIGGRRAYRLSEVDVWLERRFG